MAVTDRRVILSALAGAAVASAAARDVLQREHAITRNFPLIGRMRFLLSARSRATNAGGRTRPRNGRSTRSASGPTTIWSKRTGLLCSGSRRFRRARRRNDSRARVPTTAGTGEGSRRGARPALGVPAGVVGEHLGDELRIALTGGRGGAQPRCRARRLPADRRRGRRHGRGAGCVQRPRGDAQVRARRELHRRAARRTAVALPRLRRPAPSLIDPDRIEIISTGYRTTTLRQVFGYEPDWPLVSHARREAAIGLVGARQPVRRRGRRARRLPGAGDPTRRHMDARSLGESASETG